MAVRTGWAAAHTQLHTKSTENLGRTCSAMSMSVTSVRGLSQASGFPPAAVAKTLIQFALFGIILLCLFKSLQHTD